MSSMRNAVQRRNHRERAQPAQREKWGVLEKHKDYSLRSRDYNAKKARLKILREKAAERNPDEFSYGMLSSKTDRYGRRIHDRGNSALSHDAVKLLKTQDSGYLKTVIQQTRRTREKVEQQLYLAEERGDGVAVPCGGDWVMGGKHILFARDLEEQQILGLEKGSKEPASPDQDKLQESGQGDDTQSVERWKGSKSKAFRRVERAKAETKEITRKERALRKLRKRQKEGQQSRLMALRAREKTLIAAEQQLDHGRARMGNSVGGVNKAGVKWKIRERSK